MKAGRELNQLIAEKVMGWRRTPDDGAGGEGWDTGNADYWPYCLDFRPSEYIGHAWAVVDALRLNFDVVLECVPSHFNCHINKPNTAHLGLERNHVRAKTAPLAICLAALKVLSAPPATQNTERENK